MHVYLTNKQTKKLHLKKPHIFLLTLIKSIQTYISLLNNERQKIHFFGQVLSHKNLPLLSIKKYIYSSTAKTTTTKIIIKHN